MTPDALGVPAADMGQAQLFSGGFVVATPAALECMRSHQVEPISLLSRHLRGDWGELDADDARANDVAVQAGDRILSSYTIGAGCKVWILTEADRSSTTLLRPEDY